MSRKFWEVAIQGFLDYWPNFFFSFTIWFSKKRKKTNAQKLIFQKTRVFCNDIWNFCFLTQIITDWNNTKSTLLLCPKWRNLIHRRDAKSYIFLLSQKRWEDPQGVRFLNPFWQILKGLNRTIWQILAYFCTRFFLILKLTVVILKNAKKLLQSVIPKIQLTVAILPKQQILMTLDKSQKLYQWEKYDSCLKMCWDVGLGLGCRVRV